MTLVMAWREPSDGGVWLVSDSRISNQGPSGGQVISSDHAAKVLPIHVALVKQEVGEPQPRPTLRATLGMAYAGSTLVALQSYTAVALLWRNLQVSGPTPLPSMAEFAQHLAGFIRSYGRDLGASVSPPPSCDCILLGSILPNDPPHAFGIQLGSSGQGLDTSVTRLDLEDGGVAMLGSGEPDARHRLREYDPRDYHDVTVLRPLQVLRRTLRDASAGPVGGGAQIGYLSGGGFMVYGDVQPIEVGRSPAAMQFLGFEMEDIGTVGGAFVNLPALA